MKQPRESRADRRYDEQIVVACGEKPAYHITSWPGGCDEKKSSGESQTGIARDAGTRIASALSPSASTKEERVGSRGSRRAKSNLAFGYDQDLGGAHGGLGIFGECDRLLQEGNRELESSHRCRTEEALDAVEQAVLARLPEGSRDARVT
jgi:hypothetical protein